jgi:hypothetical protein
MMEAAMTEFADNSMELALREALVRGDEQIVFARHVLRHFLSNDDRSIFSDAILARVRGMLADIERQLLSMLAEKLGIDDSDRYLADRSGPVLEALGANSLILPHVHGLAIEWQVMEGLHSRNGVDPVLSPMLQRLIACDDTVQAETGMSVLTAQTRFVQQQRRMELPLEELPGDLFHAALRAGYGAVPVDEAECAREAEAALRASYDEALSRIGLMARLVTGLKAGGAEALDLSDAGLSLFLTSLALTSGMDRRLAAISTNEGQSTRLLLSLRSAGLTANAAAAQLAILHPEIRIPEGMDSLHGDRAAALLSDSGIALAEG